MSCSYCLAVHVLQGELLYWYSIKMFKSACVHLKHGVVEYMLSEGISPAAPGLGNMLSYVVTESGSNDCSAVLRLLVHAGFDLNEQVKRLIELNFLSLIFSGSPNFGRLFTMLVSCS
jgi:hypothetical protein